MKVTFLDVPEVSPLGRQVFDDERRLVVLARSFERVFES